jgi:hypothetical protein
MGRIDADDDVVRERGVYVVTQAEFDDAAVAGCQGPVRRRSPQQPVEVVDGEFSEVRPVTSRACVVGHLLLQAGRGRPLASADVTGTLPDELLDAVIRLLRLLDSPRDQAVLVPVFTSALP